MSLLYNKIIESVKTAIYESLFDDIDDIVTDNDNVSIIGDKLRGNYKYIDLGLPSGTLWCTKNLGAETETDPGNYYQWGYTEPVHAKRIFKTDYTKFNPSGNNKTFTKYSKNKVHYQLENIDDAAYQETNGFFRIPTPEQFEELIKYCNWKWCDTNGNTIPGYKITSKKRGNKEFIYLPAAGNITTGFSSYGSYGYGNYWTSYNTSDPKYMNIYRNNIKAYAQSLYFSYDIKYESERPHIKQEPRFCALSIRPVFNS